MMPNSTANMLEIERVFDAPPEIVFAMWKNPDHIVRWYGPEGLALTACEQDFRVGGAWRRCMSKGPDHAHWVSGTFLEITEPQRLSFTYTNAYDGFETVVTMDFSPQQGKTLMRFRQSPFISKEECDGHGWGWNSSFDLLQAYVAQFLPDDLRPKGKPRQSGVAADISAARARHQEEQANAHASQDR